MLCRLDTPLVAAVSFLLFGSLLGATQRAVGSSQAYPVFLRQVASRQGYVSAPWQAYPATNPQAYPVAAPRQGYPLAPQYGQPHVSHSYYPMPYAYDRSMNVSLNPQLRKLEVLCCKVTTQDGYFYCLSTSCGKYGGHVPVVAGIQSVGPHTCPSGEYCCNVWNMLHQARTKQKVGGKSPAPAATAEAAQPTDPHASPQQKGSDSKQQTMTDAPSEEVKKQETSVNAPKAKKHEKDDDEDEEDENDDDEDEDEESPPASRKGDGHGDPAQKVTVPNKQDGVVDMPPIEQLRKLSVEEFTEFQGKLSPEQIKSLSKMIADEQQAKQQQPQQQQQPPQQQPPPQQPPPQQPQQPPQQPPQQAEPRQSVPSQSLALSPIVISAIT